MISTTAPTGESPTDQNTNTDTNTDVEVDIDVSWQARMAEASRNMAANAAIRARADTRSLTWRNRRQLRPLAVSAATAATGTAGALLAEHSEQVTLLAAAPATGAVALAGSWVTVKRVSDTLPDDIATRLKAGLAAGCAWCAALPLTGADNLGMWLGLGLGTVAASARWWQRIRPGHPDTPQQPAPAMPAPQDAPDPGEAELIMARFVTHVTRGPRAALQGADIATPRRTPHGWAFDLTLVPGEQDIDTVRQVIGKIASAIDLYPKGAYTFEQGDAVTSVEMRITTGNAMDGVLYEGPRIVRDGGDVYIEIGPYQDGQGYERFHVLSEQDSADSADGPSGSVHGGFLLGSKNSGKSRVFELLAIGLRRLGIQVWWLDPQNGASSTALKKHADWSLMGEHGGRVFGNARDLLSALHGVRDIRNAEQGHRGEIGFVHTAERPAIFVLIDECHKVFNEKNPDTGNKFGHDFGELDREFRKLGGTFIGGSQIFTMDTFGNSAALRSGMTTGNLFVLRMKEKAHAGLLPKHSPSPDEIPKGGGYGYNPEGERPQALWRSEKVVDAAGWLASLPAGELDPRSAKAAGEPYLRRNEVAERQAQATGDLLDAFDNAEDGANAAQLLRAHRGDKSGSEANAPAGSAGTSRVPARPTLSVVGGDTEQAPPNGGQLAERHQQIIDLLVTYDRLSTDQLAEELAVSAVTVRKRLRALGESGRVRETSERGVYALGR